MSSKTCDQCGKCFTSIHRTTCYICEPTTGPSKAQMLAMAGLEDDGGSCSVGGMAVDLGLYPTVEQADDMAAVIADLQAKLDAAEKRVAELEQTFSLMAMLRGDDWCVVLKCLPASMNWIIEGGRSEYDTQSPDIKLGEGKWCCELSCMRMMKGDGMSGYRVPVWALHESPYEAVRLAYERATVTQ